MKEENRIRNDLNNDTSHWWLRSAYSNVGYDVAFVYYDGYVYNGTCYNEHGVVPAFII